MSDARASRSGIVLIVLSSCACAPAAKPDGPSLDALRNLVEDYAHAVETNNRELALWYVHPQAPRRSEIDSTLRDQLGSYLERARTLQLQPLEAFDGSISAQVDQEFVRVFGMKFTRGKRRSIYQFRRLGDSWRIWSIKDVQQPSQRRP
jgi:hypothetical protein